MITIESLLLTSFSGWVIAIMAVALMLVEQYCYDRRIKALEKMYEEQVYRSVDRCKERLCIRAYREGVDDTLAEIESNEELRDALRRVDDTRTTAERDNSGVVHATGDRDGSR